MKRPLGSLGVAGLLLIASGAQAGQTDALFTLTARANPDAIAPGKPSLAEIEVKVKPEGHISQEAPFKAVLSGKGLQPAKQALTRADGTYQGGGAIFRVPFTAGTERGAAALEAHVVFYICAKEICERQERDVRVPVTVR